MFNSINFYCLFNVIYPNYQNQLFRYVTLLFCNKCTLCCRYGCSVDELTTLPGVILLVFVYREMSTLSKYVPSGVCAPSCMMRHL
jgi:hypothetical protein